MNCHGYNSHLFLDSGSTDPQETSFQAQSILLFISLLLKGKLSPNLSGTQIEFKMFQNQQIEIKTNAKVSFARALLVQ